MWALPPLRRAGLRPCFCLGARRERELDVERACQLAGGGGAALGEGVGRGALCPDDVQD